MLISYNTSAEVIEVEERVLTAAAAEVVGERSKAVADLEDT